jgi:hypothetical protein
MYTELLAAAEDCAVGEREPIKQWNGLRRDARGFSGRHIVHSSPGHRLLQWGMHVMAQLGGLPPAGLKGSGARFLAVVGVGDGLA